MAFDPTTMMAVFAGFMILLVLVTLAWIILMIWALFDMLSARNEATWKILWLLVVLLVPIIGVILYFVIGREQKKEGRARKKRR